LCPFHRCHKNMEKERSIDSHWAGAWVGPKFGLDDVERRKEVSQRQKWSDGTSCMKFTWMVLLRNNTYSLIIEQYILY
jgi:hypothetical protein